VLRWDGKLPEIKRLQTRPDGCAAFLEEGYAQGHPRQPGRRIVHPWSGRRDKGENRRSQRPKYRFRNDMVLPRRYRSSRAREGRES